jgi:hypothetical protein
MGCPKGSKNKSGHKAGGDQKSQDAKKKNQPKKIDHPCGVVMTTVAW